MDLHPLLLFLHVAGVVVWVGGMFFAYVCLRPEAASQLEPPPRLRTRRPTNPVRPSERLRVTVTR